MSATQHEKVYKPINYKGLVIKIERVTWSKGDISHYFVDFCIPSGPRVAFEEYWEFNFNDVRKIAKRYVDSYRSELMRLARKVRR